MFHTAIRTVRDMTAFHWTRLSTTAIMILAAYVSYGHQRELLLEWGVQPTSAAIVPITVDLLAITCNITLHIPDIARRGFWTSLAVLIIAVGASGTANWIAGANEVEKAANLWTVVAYLLSEFVTATAKSKDRDDAAERSTGRRIKTDDERLEDARKRAGYYQMSTADRGIWTRKYNEKLAKRNAATAPTSPAWVIEGREPSAEETASITA